MAHSIEQEQPAKQTDKVWINVHTLYIYPGILVWITSTNIYMVDNGKYMRKLGKILFDMFYQSISIIRKNIKLKQNGINKSGEWHLIYVLKLSLT